MHADAPASIVDDLLHNTPNITVTLREVEGTELRRRLVVVGVRLELEVAKQENRSHTFQLNEQATYDGMGAPLCPNYPTHRLSAQKA
jgi:hypothetical protein